MFGVPSNRTKVAIKTLKRHASYVTNNDNILFRQECVVGVPMQPIHIKISVINQMYYMHVGRRMLVYINIQTQRQIGKYISAEDLTSDFEKKKHGMKLCFEPTSDVVILTSSNPIRSRFHANKLNKYYQQQLRLYEQSAFTDSPNSNEINSHTKCRG